MSTVFFVSTGRTGTTFITKFFNAVVNNAFSLHEPRPVFRRPKAFFYSGKYKTYHKLRFQLTRNYWKWKHEEDWYVESNHHLFAAIPLIRASFPEAKIVHIVRDGRPMVTSWLNRYRYITNNNLPAAAIQDLEAMAAWDNWTPLQKTTWYWKTVNAHMRTTSPDVTVKFENLFTENPEESQFFDILDSMHGVSYEREEVLKFLTKKVNKNKQQFFPDYEAWPAQWKEDFWEIAGEEMAYHGYH